MSTVQNRGRRNTGSSSAHHTRPTTRRQPSQTRHNTSSPRSGQSHGTSNANRSSQPASTEQGRGQARSSHGEGSRKPDEVSIDRSKDEPKSDRVKTFEDAWGAAEPTAAGTAEPTAAPAETPSEAAANKPRTPDQHFQYQPRNYQDLTEAQAYSPMTELGSQRMTGTQANDQINHDYHQINQDMQRYLAGDPNGERLPDVADWTTFGKYASREAGENIRNTEDVLQALNGDAKAATDLMRNGITSTNIAQGTLVSADIAQRALGKNAGAFAKAAVKSAGGNPAGAAEGFAAAQDSSGEAGKLGADSLFKINQGLVKGNTEIHRNIAPAYDAFLAGEADGRGGMEALSQAGYSKGSDKDKQGFVSGAFTDYQKARDLGVQAQSETDPAKKQKLLAERQQLMERGNLMIGMQEQMEILQRPGIFEDPDMRRVIGASAGTMNLTDANGRHDLLPQGGNWTDFQTRMGLNQVDKGTEGAIPVTHPDGQTRYYTPDPSQTGTIVDYFTQNASGEAARNLNVNAPRPVETTPTTGTGHSLDGIGNGINNGDVSQVVGNTAALPARLAGDLSGVASQALDQNANSRYTSGYQQIVQGQNQGGVVGTFNQVAGSMEMLEGGLSETVGDYAQGAANGLQAVGDHVENVADSYDNGVVSPINENAVWWTGYNPFARGNFLNRFATH